MLRDDRVTSVCGFVRLPWRTSHFLLLVQEKVTKEKHALGVAPGAKRRVRYGRPGFCRQSFPGLRQKRRDPSRRPARSAGLIRPPSAAPQRVPKIKSRPKASAAGTAALLLFPGSLSAAASRRRKKPRSG